MGNLFNNRKQLTFAETDLLKKNCLKPIYHKIPPNHTTLTISTHTTTQINNSIIDITTIKTSHSISNAVNMDIFLNNKINFLQDNCKISIFTGGDKILESMIHTELFAKKEDAVAFIKSLKSHGNNE